MKELLSTVTMKGQVTIPVEVRRLLGVEPHEKVAFIVEGDQVRVARRSSVVQRTAGMLRSDRPALTAEELREAGERAIAEDVAERLRDWRGHAVLGHQHHLAALARRSS